MLVEQELSHQASRKDTVLTIGVFDGVHLGHRHLLDEVKRQAQSLGCLSAVVTFRQHPEKLISPGKELPYLTSLDERIKRLKKEGIDSVVVLSFNNELAEIEARHFISLLKKYLHIVALVVGPDFALGKNRKGEPNYLRELGKEMDFTVSIVLPKIINGEIVSSTAIRKALAQGDMKHVFTLAGQYFTLGGPVVTGAGRGGGILGYPTANLDVDSEQALPPNGVYATLSHIDNRTYQSLTNIGVRPTFDNGNRTIEVFILDYAGNLYGKELKVDFIERLRAEKKFDKAEELQKQIAEDIRIGKIILSKANNIGQ
jgi:riboflavin kinase/FMN adenylyltransferase